MTIFFISLFSKKEWWNNENASTQMILNMNNIISKRMFGESVARIEYRFIIKFNEFLKYL